MSNGNTDADWFDTTNEAKKQLRRDAADLFLEKSKDAEFRQRVLKSDEEARKEFSAFYRQVAGIEIPEGVRVICVDPDLKERSKLVVLLLPTQDSPTTASWRDGWIASWQPY